MSVDIEALIADGGNDPADYVTSEDFPGAVAFSAAEIHELAPVSTGHPA